jgi:hypothetical protein
MRVAMLAAAVPTAILANALRVAFSGLSPELTSGTPHALLGTFIFLLCLGLLAGVYQLFALTPSGKLTPSYNRTCKNQMQSSSEPDTTA